MTLELCSRSRRDPLIVVQESGRKFTLRNARREQVLEITIDDCLITAGERCDYLFEVGAPCRLAIFVELKGAAIEKAYRQLMATIKSTSDRTYRNTVCHIVASRVPRQGPQVQQLQAKMIKEANARLRISTSHAIVDVADPLYS
jgi:hypothetical protein